MDADSSNVTKPKEEAKRFSIPLDSVQDFEFCVKFDHRQLQDLIIDEPSPLEHSSGLDPARLLAAAIGVRLSAALFFCAQKSHLNMPGLQADIIVAHAP